ncbi:hypothetical protein BVC80_1837g215 [Macleaya cordata]|uniref:RNase H type-1 domain-containing protein n=1 Tax=Macleaya cordata TaxID=56857 RepID=A0A200R3V0_MACCD|nr:hypothetical protein BVC80_1837g215 [Macleaya cordata]
MEYLVPQQKHTQLLRILTTPRWYLAISKLQKTKRPPLINQLKINYDASFVSNDTYAGIGLILRDGTGSCKGVRAERCNTLSPEEAEGCAVLAAFKWAQELSLINCCIEDDSKSISDYLLRKRTNLSWRTVSILNEAMMIKDTTNLNFSTSFVFRSANSVADLLAKEARYFHSDQTWLDNYPTILCPLLSADTNSDPSIFV